MAYIEQGQGPPLVLVHGALIDYRYWAAQVEQFSAAHRVIAVSLDWTGYYYGHLADVFRELRCRKVVLDGEAVEQDAPV